MINLQGKQVASGSVGDLVDWLESHPNKGNKMLGVWVDNLLTADNGKMNKKSRVTGEATIVAFPQGIRRESYRTYALGVIYGNAVNTGRVQAAEMVATRLGIDPDAVEIEYFNPEGLWKGAGAKYSTYTVIHKPSGKLYFAGRPAQDGEGNVKVLESIWRNNSDNRIITLDDVRDFLPPKYDSFTTVEVGGMTVKVEKPPYRCQSLEGVKGVVYANTAFLVTDPSGCVAPIAA